MKAATNRRWRCSEEGRSPKVGLRPSSPKPFLAGASSNSIRAMRPYTGPCNDSCPTAGLWEGVRELEGAQEEGEAQGAEGEQGMVRLDPGSVGERAARNPPRRQRFPLQNSWSEDQRRGEGKCAYCQKYLLLSRRFHRRTSWLALTDNRTLCS